MIRFFVAAVLVSTLAAATQERVREPRVRVGLEVVASQSGGALRGKRVGLVVHGASVTADGRRAVDVLRAAGVDVARLFTPEHGLASQAAAGEKVASGVDTATGLPVVSLYGERIRPSLHDLQGLDALVVDLQDAGVRFYTYVSTLILCRDAAAEAAIELVVLDRPNPLGGERIDGPVSDPREVVPESLVNRAPGPLIHGLTLGEMARLVNATALRKARVTVVPMQGWKRGFVWSETGRPWVPPSPNLRSADAVLAYPGVCLLEATNVSEGRGTDTPFLLLGAPWMGTRDPLGRVKAPGFALESARFTPRASEAAPRPKHEGMECRGVRVRVTNGRRARGYELGLRLLQALHREPEFRWAREAALDGLVGTRGVRESLERGWTVERILAADEPAIEAFRRARKPALLY